MRTLRERLVAIMAFDCAILTLDSKHGLIVFDICSENGDISPRLGSESRVAKARIDEKGARRPVSRVLSPPRTAGDGHSSGTSVAGRLARPTRAPGAETRLPQETRGVSPLFGLAPGGVCPAAVVAAGAVRSYRTLSPLPAGPGWAGVRAGGLLSVALSLGSPPPGVTRLRFPVEPGLSSGQSAKRTYRRSSGRLAGADYTARPVCASRCWRIARVAPSATPSTRAWRK